MTNQFVSKNDRSYQPLTILTVVAVLGGAVLAGLIGSPILLLFIGTALGGLALMRWPVGGLLLLIIVAILVPVEISTGTEVPLNGTVVIIPALMAIWFTYRLVSKKSPTVYSMIFLPLALFLISGLLSLFIGNALWDPQVPKPSSFLLVQLAQWSIFLLSAIVYFISANLIDTENRLTFLVLSFLAIGGPVSILIILFGANRLVGVVTSMAVARSPFWILLAGIAGGQLLFNRELSRKWQWLSVLTLFAVIVYAFVQEREAVSNWVGVFIVASVLIWLRWPRIRIPATILTALLILTGILTQTLWEFGGGDSEWTTSGASRIVLASRVIEVSMANPVSGLGPAAYRHYAATEPLQYGRAFWVKPSVNSHNNYIDIFSQTGLVGLGFFLWFMISLFVLAWRLNRKRLSGFISGYVNGMIAVWASIMVVMLLLDWFLPFVYNVGFPGFQASILVWLFFGGLVAVDNFTQQDNGG